jgi:parallel beta-helix repeat protein
MIAAGFPGSGIEGDPYRIEHLNITTTDYNGIEINNVTLYFTIQHCIINAWGRGIMILRSPPGRVAIHNNTITGHTYEAIDVALAQNTTITNNRFRYNGGNGIMVSGSAGTEIINNNCSWNDDHGIVIMGNSSNCLIYNNRIKRNGDYGIILADDPDNCTIYHNNLIDNHLSHVYGPSQASDDSTGTKWYNNTLQEGNWWWDWSGTGFYSIDGTAGTSDIYPLLTPVTPPTPHDPIFIDSNDDFISYGFKGTGIAKDPYLIENLEIITITNSCGIHIKDTTKSFIIRNCIIDALDYGILVSNTSLRTLSSIDSNIIENNYYGIFVNNTFVPLIVNNTCRYNNYAINVTNCDYVLVDGNKCFDNLNKSISVQTSENAWVTFNHCYSGSEEGIIIRECPYSTVIHNVCLLNGDDNALELLGFGIRILSSSYTLVKNNTCMENLECGIDVNTGSLYTIEENFCFNNHYTGIQTWGVLSSLINNNTCIGNPYGILLYDATTTTITNNTVRYSNWAGMSLAEVSGCTFSYNLIQDTTNYGMEFIHLSSNNKIHHNKFIDNNPGGSSQAFDEGNQNIWYQASTNEGNYWNEYVPPGSYSIDGSSSSEDLYPLNEFGIPYIPEFNSSIALVTISITFLIMIVNLRKRND